MKIKIEWLGKCGEVSCAIRITNPISGDNTTSYASSKSQDETLAAFFCDNVTIKQYEHINLPINFPR